MKFFSTVSLYCFITVCWCLIFFSSCSPKGVVENLELPSKNASVKNGRLFFVDSKKYLAYLTELSNLSDTEKEAKVKDLAFTTLQSTNKDDFFGPTVYKYILNHNHEIQVGNMVVHMTDSDTYIVPADNEKLIHLLSTDINSQELIAYKKSAVRSLKKLIPKDVSSGNASARYNDTYEDRRYHNIGPIGGVGNFRFQLFLRESCDNLGGAFVTVVSLLEYQSPRNGGWYGETQALVYGTLKNITWTFRPADDYGHPANYTISGSSADKTYNWAKPTYAGTFVQQTVMNSSYRDFGYTPEMRVEVDYNLQAYYNGGYCIPWTGHMTFVTQ